jgi:mRNA interferase RelE/StbE
VRKFKIIFASIAEKQLMKCNRLVRARICIAIAKLAEDPFRGKQLKGQLKDLRSYRVGDYRVVYSVLKKGVQIHIIRIAHPRDVYRQ